MGLNVRNAAALIRDDITTISLETDVGLQNAKCPRQLASTLSVGDYVVAQRMGEFLAARVRDIHDEAMLDAEDENRTNYTWAFQRVQTAFLRELLATEEEFVAEVERRAAKPAQTSLRGRLGLTQEDIDAIKARSGGPGGPGGQP